MKVLCGLALGVWYGYYKATQRHIWNDFEVVWIGNELCIRPAKKREGSE